MAKIKMKMSKEVTFWEGCERFFKWCEVKNYAPESIRFYKNAIHNFSRFCDLDIPMSKIDEELIKDYILFLRAKDISSVTIDCYLRGLKRVINHLTEVGLLEPVKIIMPKIEMPAKEVYTESELKKLLRKPNLKTCRFPEYRNWVIVNYLLGTGQRRKTIVNLKIKDIDIENGLVHLRVVKNKRGSVLPITKSLVMILEEYMNYRGGEKEDYLFCNSDGNPIGCDSLTTAIRKYNIRRGVSKTSIHTFRHTFAYLAMKNNMEIIRLQQLLGHSKLDTTQNYLKSFGYEDLKENYERYNPLEVFAGEKAISKNWKNKNA